jgi:prepilin-type N-terminal cleavage/methylation domain-containing protein
MVTVRAGFSLAEVIVAMTLLSIGTLAVAATGFVAAQAFTRAEMQEQVLRGAEQILDSLAALPGNAAGARDIHGAHLAWTAADSASAITMLVNLPDRPSFQLSAQR